MSSEVQNSDIAERTRKNCRQASARRVAPRARRPDGAPSAGYEMPVHYEGIMAENLLDARDASLFNISHIGQLSSISERLASALEALMPGEALAAADMKPKYWLAA